MEVRMEWLKTPTQSFNDVGVSEGSAVHEKVLWSLQLDGPMPVEKLVERNPHFRWVEVLRAVSHLWGEGLLELEQCQGQLMVQSIVTGNHVKFPRKRIRKRETESCELTVS